MNQIEKLKQTEWISIEEASAILNLTVKTLKKHCNEEKLIYKIVINKKRRNYFISTKSLIKNYICADENLKTYSDAPKWAKVQAEKYLPLIQKTRGLKGKALKRFIENWNKNNPENKTSYPSLLRMRKRYFEKGCSGLLSRYGTNASKSTVTDEYFDYFKNLYLVESAPSVQSCWHQTLGYAIRTNHIDKTKFPSPSAFKRRIEKAIPKQSIYLARFGQAAWNVKYGNHIERDYSYPFITCGSIWVSDHAQIDVSCKTKDGNIVCPWVTVWRDYKSGKWLGWILQTNHPNSDHIFQSFYYATEKFGIPNDVIIDNGKDYRSKDFAGGRKIEVNQSETRCMLNELDIEVHFALPYNAQTKPIERDFNKLKEWLSKHSVGYRGGNVVERPEKLANEIKNDKIMDFEDFKKIFDKFITNVFNKYPSKGKNLNGQSPDELFNAEFVEKKVPSKDALKLFCMRTSKTFTIGRNGIKDSALGITYWADWMSLKKGMKVYLRRDIQNYSEAWAFDSSNDEFIGKVKVVKTVAALHADKVSKEEFKEAMAIKKRNKKIAQSFIENQREISLEEKYENYRVVFENTNEPIAKPKVTKLANTKMDKAIRKNKEMKNFGKYDLSGFLNESQEEETLYLFETDKIIAEENKKYLNLMKGKAVNEY